MYEIEEKIDIRDKRVILDSEMFIIKYHEEIVNYE